MTCPYCGSENVRYLGVSDGGGDYSTSICDEYRCDECGIDYEENCVEESEFDRDLSILWEIIIGCG